MFILKYQVCHWPKIFIFSKQSIRFEFDQTTDINSKHCWRCCKWFVFPFAHVVTFNEIFPWIKSFLLPIYFKIKCCIVKIKSFNVKPYWLVVYGQLLHLVSINVCVLIFYTPIKHSFVIKIILKENFYHLTAIFSILYDHNLTENRCTEIFFLEFQVISV